MKLRWNVLYWHAKLRLSLSSETCWKHFFALSEMFLELCSLSLISSDSRIWKHTHSPKPYNTNYFNYLLKNHILPGGRGSNVFIPIHGNLNPAGTAGMCESSRSCSRTRPAGNIVTVLPLLICFNGRRREPTIRADGLLMRVKKYAIAAKFKLFRLREMVCL